MDVVGPLVVVVVLVVVGLPVVVTRAGVVVDGCGEVVGPAVVVNGGLVVGTEVVGNEVVNGGLVVGNEVVGTGVVGGLVVGGLVVGTEVVNCGVLGGTLGELPGSPSCAETTAGMDAEIIAGATYAAALSAIRIASRRDISPPRVLFPTVAPLSLMAPFRIT